MKMKIKIDNLGIDSVAISNALRAIDFKTKCIYVTMSINDNMIKKCCVDPINIIGRVQRIDGLIAEVTFVDTLAGRDVERVVDNNSKMFYITPRLITDNDGDIEKIIAFDLHVLSTYDMLDNKIKSQIRRI